MSGLALEIGGSRIRLFRASLNFAISVSLRSRRPVGIRRGSFRQAIIRAAVVDDLDTFLMRGGLKLLYWGFERRLIENSVMEERS